jgi:hypothetical protein
MDLPVPMSIDTHRFTQSGRTQSAIGSPNSPGTSSTPSVTYTSAIAIVKPPGIKRLSRLSSFVAALNGRDYMRGRIEPKGEGADTSNVSALVLTADTSSLECSTAYRGGSQLQRSVTTSDSAIRCVTRCFRQLDVLDTGMASLSVKTNWAYWQLGKAYEAFCEVSRLFARSLCLSCL